jgi:DNA processing protein
VTRRVTRRADDATAACDRCVARAWLLGRLAGHLEHARGQIHAVLALSNEDLIAAGGGSRRDALADELERLDLDAARRRSRDAGVAAVCRCDPAYPVRLRALDAPPAVLHVAGGVERFVKLVAQDPVAIVGARAASPYGTAVARSLGHGLGGAGLTVLSGMAHGIDSAAHAGALDAGAPTIAILPGPPNRVYPAGGRALHRRLTATGAAVSELPPGCAVWRWMFPARNRIIAALAAMTIVVEAGERSGALLTAGFAAALGRRVGAVPGQITMRQAAGPNHLLATGATVVRGAQDVLDAVFGAGARTAKVAERPQLAGELTRLLGAIAAGQDTAAALVRAGLAPEQGLAALASLELAGYVRRGAGGRYSVIPN